MTDLVNHPTHYTWLPNGLEVIDITEHFGFVLGSALKYIFRCDHKGEPIQDLEKARWYIDREIETRRGVQSSVEAETELLAGAELAAYTAMFAAIAAELAKVTDTPALDGGVWVHDAEAANALPVGTILGMDALMGDIDEPCFRIEKEGHHTSVDGWGRGGTVRFYDGNFAKGRKVLNPEILGTFEPVVVPPTSLYGSEYATAPVGTIVQDGFGTMERGAEGWSCSCCTRLYQSSGLSAEREVVRWGLPALKVGDVLETLEDYENAPVGVEITYNQGSPKTFTKTVYGSWLGEGSFVKTSEGMVSAEDPKSRKRTVVSLP